MDNQTTRERLELYRLFAALFFTLPDKPFVEMVRSIGIPSSDSTSLLLNEFKEDIASLSDDEVQRILRVDFARLLNGAVEQGGRPPFESVYCEEDVLDLLKRLNRQYKAWGYGFAETHGEQSDHIAKELGFMQMLCERELDQAENEQRLSQIRDTEREFLEDHLARWALRFAQESRDAARTKFYQAMCSMLSEHLANELSAFGLAPTGSAATPGSDLEDAPHESSAHSCMASSSEAVSKQQRRPLQAKPLRFGGGCPLSPSALSLGC